MAPGVDSASNRNEYPGIFLEGKGQPARKVDNFTVICESIVWKMWEPRPLTALWATTACYRDSFILSALITKFPVGNYT
jgi:hypothetical protein